MHVQQNSLDKNRPHQPDRDLTLFESTTLARQGKPLNILQRQMLKNPWEDQKYEDIAEVIYSSPALKFAESIISAKQGKTLNSLQRDILKGAWEDRKYEDIAEAIHCSEGHIKDVAASLWQQLSEELGERVGKKNFKAVLERRMQNAEDLPPHWREKQKTEPTKQHLDWGDAPDVSTFYGRNQELTTLEQWIVQDRCRLVTLQGMGGIGKTALAAKLAELVQDKFEGLIWRSLHNAPFLEETLPTLLQSLSSEPSDHLPSSCDRRILLLLEWLRASRCLLVLDGAESILQSGERTGCYREGYEGYSQLFLCIGKSNHQSCLLLTTREKPEGLAAEEGETLPVRCLQLKGMQFEAAREILRAKGTFCGTGEEWRALIDYYGGNPLALKIVAAGIQELFDGNLSEFLEYLRQGILVFDELWNLLDQQFNRLPTLEREIMCWLSRNGKPVGIPQLQEKIFLSGSGANLPEALRTLRQRSLIENTSDGFTLQPMVMEYMTKRILAR
ncbi:MAG: NACHT domain-containing protein [Chlorogloeopsis fritschii C42_A2020_084]|uniref:NB-ARC domain-containing protein n=1 Tax=Chlorogloeopsis fritschii TaxID=1124 RepID=UPI0019DB269A|nr:NB-ARC domain-containing protein [Chlorogloeopsis fritschii]MBF2006981.1 NACHT domain-containing protein [Chlorogloeopsis fritschii C42_A2020_084]